MDNYKFEKICKNIVRGYLKEKGIEINIDNVYTVWLCRALGNNKALISTTIEDNLYYELTYNGAKKEIYFDVYKKELNKVISENDFNEEV